jgi:hypothetical protein
VETGGCPSHTGMQMLFPEKQHILLF